MAEKNVPYESYTNEQIVKAYESTGVRGLEQLNLSDADIIVALRGNCIGAPDITRTLKEAGWSRQRFMKAEEEYGVDSGPLELFLIEYDSLPLEALKEQIEERKLQARENNIEEKASLVARCLGFEDTYPDRRIKGYRAHYRGGDIEITDSAGSATTAEDHGHPVGGTTIKYGGEIVFDVFLTDISSYIPGQWEEILDSLYEKAIPACEEKQQERETRRTEIAQEDEQKEKDKWGL